MFQILTNNARIKNGGLNKPSRYCHQTFVKPSTRKLTTPRPDFSTDLGRIKFEDRIHNRLFNKKDGDGQRKVVWNSFDRSPMPGDLPDDVTVLEFEPGFEAPLQPGSMPTMLQTLKLPHKLLFERSPNQHGYPHRVGPQVLHTAKNLRTVEMGTSEAQVLPGDLPHWIEHLTMGFSNDPIVPGSLPENLLELTLGPRFDRFIDVGVLPERLVYLNTGMFFNQSFFSTSSRPDFTGFPEDADVEKSSGYEKKKTGDDDNDNNHAEKIKRSILPSGLRCLWLGRYYDRIIMPGELPSGLRYLRLGEYSRAPIVSGSLPSGLLMLATGSLFNQPLVGLPWSLRRLLLPRGYRHPVDSIPAECSIEYVVD